jgi:hypothetical protein
VDQHLLRKRGDGLGRQTAEVRGVEIVQVLHALIMPTVTGARHAG